MAELTRQRRARYGAIPSVRAVLITPAPPRRGLPALATRLRSITELPALLTGRPTHG
jgi:hypothetical protein